MQGKFIYLILAFLPILALIIFSLFKSIRFAALATLLLTTGLFFLWGAPVNYFLAALVTSLISTINILMIVFGAVFLFEVMKDAGYIEGIKQSMQEIHANRTVQFFLITVGLTGFFEGIAGFGTPGAIIPLLLISIGFSPVFSVTAVLLVDGLYAAFGAVGTPLLLGLKLPLQLTDTDTLFIGRYTAGLVVLAAIIFLAVIYNLYGKLEGKIVSVGAVAGICISALAFYLFVAFLFPEFTSILSPVLMLVLMILVFTQGKPAIPVKPWMPYLGLIFLLLLPKLSPALNTLSNYELRLEQLFASEIFSSFKPLKSPLIPFLIISVIIILIKKEGKRALETATAKLIAVFIILFPIILVSQLMIYSGVKQPSMIAYIAQAFGYTGVYYLILSPFVGILGTFITGSTTVSNIVFGLSQAETAHLLGLDSSLILSLQLAGASIGNAICLFNIVAAAVVAGIPNTNALLKRMIAPVLLAGLVIGVAGMVIHLYINPG